MYDHSLAPRLGQPTAVENTAVQMFSSEDIPQANWPGRMIYRTDTQVLQIYNGVAFEDAVSGQKGQLTFVGPRVIGPPDQGPLANGEGDLWFDTHPGDVNLGIAAGQRKLYRAEAEGSLDITPAGGGGWVLMADDRIGDLQTEVLDIHEAMEVLSENVSPQDPPAESPTLAVVPMSKGLLLNATGEVETTTWLLYEVATDSGFSSIVASSNTRQSSVVISDVPEETDLWARVTAYNAAGAATPSASVGPVQTLILGVSDLPDLADAVDTANQAILDALAAAQAAQAAQDTADGAIRTFYQETAPWANGSTQPASSVGDLWYREPDGAVFRWTGTTWSQIPDTQAAAALAAAEASSKVYIQPTAPTGRAQDLWIDTTGGLNTPKRWNGSTWVAATDKVATDAAAAVTALDGRVTTTEGAISSVESRVTTAEGEINTVETRMDTAEGSITTLSSDVTSLDSTVSSHTTRLTTAEGEITTLDGRVDNAELSITSHDTRLDDAESDIVDIVTVQLPGKSKSTYSTSAPGTTPNTAGDLWWHKDSTSGQIIALYEGTGGTGWVKREINGAVLKDLDAGTITVGTLAAARIGANTIDSTKIVTAGLDAGVIKFGTMSGDRIEAGSLTVGQVGGLQAELDAKAAAAALAAGLENKVVNGGFEDGLNGWLNTNRVTIDTTVFRSGSQSARLDAGSIDLNTPQVPVAEGETWRWECWYKTSADFAGNLGMRPIRYGVTSGNVPGHVNITLNEEWTKISFDWTVEPGYDRVNMRFASSITAGSVWVDDLRLTNVTDLKELEAAAAESYERWAPTGQTTIDGGKITTHSITSDHIVAGGLAVGTITGLQSALDEIDGDLSAIHIVDPIPTMSSNSPSAGRISWTAFDVRYGGATTTVPAGDTANRYVIYRWNSGTPTVEQTNTKPTLGAGDFWLFSNLAGVPVRIFAAINVDGDLLVEGSVTADALAANTITADEIAADAITADEIAADAVTADKIKSGEITTDKIVTAGLDAAVIKFGTMSGDRIETGSLTVGHVSGLTPVVNDSLSSQYFSDTFETTDSLSRWSSNYPAGWTIESPTDAEYGSTVFRSDSVYKIAYHEKKIPFDPNVTYKVTVRARGVSGAPRLSAGVRMFRADGTTAGSSNGNWYGAVQNTYVPVGTTWNEYTGYFKGIQAPNGNLQSGNSTLTLPGLLAEGTTYFSPLMLPNYQANPGDVLEISMFKIEALPIGQQTADAYERWAPTGQTTIDGGNITADSITSAQIDTGAITAEHLGADLAEINNLAVGEMSAEYALLGSLSIGPDSDNPVIEIGAAAGLSVNHPDGTISGVEADGSGATWRGDSYVDNLTVEESMSLRGNELYVAGAMTLTTGVSNPTQRPQVTTGYQSYPTSGPGFNRRGLGDHHYWSDRYVCTDGLAPAYGGWVVQDWLRTANGGTGYGSFAINSSFEGLGGVTYMGGYYYVLAQQYTNKSNWRILVYEASGSTLDGAIYRGQYMTNPSQSGSISPSALPMIGHNGSNVVVVWPENSKLNLRQYLPYNGGGTSLNQTGSTQISSDGWNANAEVKGVAYQGGNYYIASNGDIRAYSTSMNRTTGQEFPPAAGNIVGLSHDGTQFWSFHDNGSRIYQYTNNSGTWKFAFAWRDNDSGGAGVAETKIGPILTTAPKKFARWKVTIPGNPPDDGTVDGANTASIYAGRSSDPDPFRQTILAEGNLSVWYDSLATSGTTPQSSNGFANRSGAIGELRSPSGLTTIDGNDAVKMSKFIQSGTATVTLSAAASGFIYVTFPTDFDSVPYVIVTPVETTVFFGAATLITANGFRAQVRHHQNTALTANIPVHWIATVAN